MELNIKRELKLLSEWKAGSCVSQEAVNRFGTENCFRSEEISKSIVQRINGISYKPNDNVSISDLRYVKVLHYDIDNRIHLGELICNKMIADDLVNIFFELYCEQYPIHKMVLIDEYGADDEKSMSDNNTSCFCYRTIAGTDRLSNHAYGKAIDINPLFNPCVERKNGALVVAPASGQIYAARTKRTPYRITRNSLCYKVFIKHGFKWGGDWNSFKDYQHFEKKEPVKDEDKKNLFELKKQYIFWAVLASLLAMLTPLLFTRPHFGINWGTPNQVGDTFAIAVPFLTLISIWLTFAAFWVQYRANKNQEKISEEQLELSRIQSDISRKQQEEIQLERFTNTYMSFIQLLNNQENETYIKEVGYSKQAFHYMFYEYKCIALLTYNYLIKKKMTSLANTNNRKYVLTQAYNIFINGISKTTNAKIKENARFGDILGNYFLKTRDGLEKTPKPVPYLTDYPTEDILLFDGHRLRIIPFFNSVCKLIEFVYRSPSIKDDEKGLYLDMMFSHFSEHEMALLKIVYRFEFLKNGKKEDIKFLDPLYAQSVNRFLDTGINKYISPNMNCDNPNFLNVGISCEGF